MAKDLIRYREVRRADILDDQKSPAQIANALALATTQEQLQEFVLAQLKRVIFGDAAGTWRHDFQAAGIRSLLDLSTGGVPPVVASPLLPYLEEGPLAGHREIVGTPWPTEVTWYTDATKTLKLATKTIVRNAAQAPTSITWTHFAGDGVTVIATVTDTLTLVGTPAVFETARTRVAA